MIKKESVGYLLPVSKQKEFLYFNPIHGSFQVEGLKYFDNNTDCIASKKEEHRL